MLAVLTNAELREDYWKKNRLRLMPWIFLTPGIIMFSLYVIIPIFQSIYVSFFEWDGLSDKVFIGTANYSELWEDENFYTSLKNNVIWLVLYMLAVPAGLFIALFLNSNTLRILASLMELNMMI